MLYEEDVAEQIEIAYESKRDSVDIDKERCVRSVYVHLCALLYLRAWGGVCVSGVHTKRQNFNTQLFLYCIFYLYLYLIVLAKNDEIISSLFAKTQGQDFAIFCQDN